VVDLSQLDFCDSRGIRELVHWQQLSEQDGCSLVFRSPQPYFQHVLQVLDPVGFLGLDRDA
jgi:anti-anti-sigma regulatory factor